MEHIETTEKEMTTEKCLELIALYDNEYNAQCNAARDEYERRKKLVLDAWVRQNAEFAVGDIVKFRNMIIQIDKVYGYEFYGKLTVAYAGPVMTLRLEPRMDGARSVIYPDGCKMAVLRKGGRNNK